MNEGRWWGIIDDGDRWWQSWRWWLCILDMAISGLWKAWYFPLRILALHGMTVHIIITSASFTLQGMLKRSKRWWSNDVIIKWTLISGLVWWGTLHKLNSICFWSLTVPLIKEKQETIWCLGLCLWPGLFDANPFVNQRCILSNFTISTSILNCETYLKTEAEYWQFFLNKFFWINQVYNYLLWKFWCQKYSIILCLHTLLL